MRIVQQLGANQGTLLNRQREKRMKERKKTDVETTSQLSPRKRSRQTSCLAIIRFSPFSLQWQYKGNNERTKNKEIYTRIWVWGLVLRVCVRSVRVWNVRVTSSACIYQLLWWVRACVSVCVCVCASAQERAHGGVYILMVPTHLFYFSFLHILLFFAFLSLTLHLLHGELSTSHIKYKKQSYSNHRC